MKNNKNQSKLLKQKRISSNIRIIDMPALYILCEIGVYNIKDLPVTTAINICTKLHITIEEFYSITNK